MANQLNLRKDTLVEKIQKELDKVQEEGLCRTASVEHILNALRETEKKYSHYPTDVKRLVRIEYNACGASRKDYSSVYFNKRPSSQSTWFTICYARGWKIVNIYRGSSFDKSEVHLGHIDTSEVVKLLELPKHNTLNGSQVNQVEDIEKWSQEVLEKYPLLYEQIQAWRWMLLRETFLGTDVWGELVEVERLIRNKEKEIKELLNGKKADWVSVDSSYRPVAFGEYDDEKPRSKWICATCETSRSMARRIVRDILNQGGRDVLVQVLNNTP